MSAAFLGGPDALAPEPSGARSCGDERLLGWPPGGGHPSSLGHCQCVTHQVGLKRNLSGRSNSHCGCRASDSRPVCIAVRATLGSSPPVPEGRARPIDCVTPLALATDPSVHPPPPRVLRHEPASIQSTARCRSREHLPAVALCRSLSDTGPRTPRSVPLAATITPATNSATGQLPRSGSAHSHRGFRPLVPQGCRMIANRSAVSATLT